MSNLVPIPIAIAKFENLSFIIRQFRTSLAIVLLTFFLPILFFLTPPHKLPRLLPRLRPVTFMQLIILAAALQSSTKPEG